MNFRETKTAEGLESFSFKERISVILANHESNESTIFDKARYTSNKVCQELYDAIYYRQVKGEEAIVKLLEKLKNEALEIFINNNFSDDPLKIEQAINQPIAQLMLKLLQECRITQFYMF